MNPERLFLFYECVLGDRGAWVYQGETGRTCWSLATVGTQVCEAQSLIPHCSISYLHTSCAWCCHGSGDVPLAHCFAEFNKFSDGSQHVVGHAGQSLQRVLILLCHIL